MSATRSLARSDRTEASIPCSRSSRNDAACTAWLMLGGCTVATLDMLSAMAYWGRHGVMPEHILQGITAWIVGPAAFNGGFGSALLGALLYGQLMWGVVALYHALARRQPLLLRRPLLCGGVYGAMAYIAIFQVMAPLLTGSTGPHELPWIATCAIVYITLVGMPCALFARAAGRIRV